LTQGAAAESYPAALANSAWRDIGGIGLEDVIGQIGMTEKAAAHELENVRVAADLEPFRIKYLGTNGQIRGLMKLLGNVPKDQRPAVGQRVNALKESLSGAFEKRKSEIEGATPAALVGIDITEPGTPPRLGRLHVLMRAADELVDLFGRMGFAVASGPQVEDEFHNFDALNIPPTHPARDPLDNFYLTGIAESQGPMLLRTQTSTVQIRVMETQKPPIRVVIPGRVYRPDTVDDTHLYVFHQLEALVVDRGISMIDLKSTISQFVHAYFGPTVKMRFRPSFFPFTEPSGEVDVWFEDRQRWIELGGCGMVHPNVLRTCNIDPEIYSGWAFGFGIERLAMRKYGISDIRLLIENDIRFLSQF
jgi:phenylalanyl-tRNA synthetase alpha chain